MEIITCFNDLIKLQAQLKHFNVLNKPQEYQFQLPLFSDEENLRFSTCMNSFSKECGCNTGGFIMSMGFMVTAGYYFISGGSFSGIGINQILTLAGITIGSAVAGKLFGLLRARWKMIQLISNLIFYNSNKGIISSQ